MSGETKSVRRAGSSDRETVVRLLDAAFQDDPVSGWVFPDEEGRRATHPLLMGAIVDIVLEAGRVEVLADGSAVALWMSVPDGERGRQGHEAAHESDPDSDSGDGDGEAEDEADGPAQLRAAIDPDNERIETMGRLTAEIHPRHPHEYLWLIAVDPARQGEGRGTALLRPTLDRCDREGSALYLEASSARGRDLYRRLGFTTMERTLVLPDGPTLWPMWRDPQPG
ncbi:GNAT family N-acetyltransferase [Streptomyces sp. NPDC020965]|uniref:GNAT family N-acetyltransferase n=1 Tax=Streptomyces sp. NPDC020965 TaxID=3365105 RepID=UPI0037AA5424